MDEWQLLIACASALCSGCKKFDRRYVDSERISPCSFYNTRRRYTEVVSSGHCDVAENETGSLNGRMLRISNEDITGHWEQIVS